jgi:hypothetical protein
MNEIYNKPGVERTRLSLPISRNKVLLQVVR